MHTVLYDQEVLVVYVQDENLVFLSSARILKMIILLQRLIIMKLYACTFEIIYILH